MKGEKKRRHEKKKQTGFEESLLFFFGYLIILFLVCFGFLVLLLLQSACFFILPSSSTSSSSFLQILFHVFFRFVVLVCLFSHTPSFGGVVRGGVLLSSLPIESSSSSSSSVPCCCIFVVFLKNKCKSIKYINEQRGRGSTPQPSFARSFITATGTFFFFCNTTRNTQHNATQHLSLLLQGSDKGLGRREVRGDIGGGGMGSLRPFRDKE